MKGKWQFQLVFDPKTPQAVELLATLDELHSKIKNANFKPYKKDMSKNDDGVLVETGLVAINFTSGFAPKMIDAQLTPCNVNFGWGSKVRVKFTTKPVNNKGKVGLGRYTRVIQVIEPSLGGIDTDGFNKEQGYTANINTPTEAMDYSD
jgi:hypothetical protein